MAAHQARLVDRTLPPEEWAIIVLTPIALLCPALALLDGSDTFRGAGLMLLTLLGFAAALRCARSRLSTRGAAILGSLLGAGLVVLIIGQLFPPPSLIWSDIRYAIGSLEPVQDGASGRSLPLQASLAYVWQRLGDLGARLLTWYQGFVGGDQAQDLVAAHLAAATLAWSFAFFGTWQIFRRRSVLVGLLPSGTAMATAAYFRGGTAIVFLIGFLFCMLWLLGLVYLWTKREHWDKVGADYPGDMGLELLFTLAPGLTLILLLAAFFPVIRPRPLVQAFWRLTEGPWSAVEQSAERLFGPLDSFGTDGFGPGASLPREHLLGGEPESLQAVKFYVATSDPPPPVPGLDGMDPMDTELPARYWRTTTFDTYTGQGWTNGALEAVSVPKGEPLAAYSGDVIPLEDDPSTGPELQQRFELVTSGTQLLHAANAPTQIDQPVQSWWRAPGDLVQIASDARYYSAVSRPPEPAIADLRAASPTLPPDVAERYLGLPANTPRRVADLAQEVIGDAATRYDQAYAIETFLRTYTYTLDLSLPPANRDLVDYFLFDIQKGYCDYYASAMVVMARSVGIPARLAIGYAQGTFDHESKRWVVVAGDGHSWVEIYFDGIGWVEFEPTAGLPALARAGSDLHSAQALPLPPRAPGATRFPWALPILAGTLLFLVVVVVWIRRPRRRGPASASNLVRDRYNRLVRWGPRLGHAFTDGQTPLEYGAMLGHRIQSRSKDDRWPRVRSARAKAPGQVKELTESFVRAQYAPDPLPPEEGSRLRYLWTRLRRNLWWLWLGR